MNRSNRFEVVGTLAERDALRHTPAGIPILNFRITHASEQMEAGGSRKIELELACVAVQEQAHLVAKAPLGMALKLSGFVAPKGRSSRLLVLHVNEIEFKEGI